MPKDRHLGTNVVEAHCYALQCRRIDCEQICSIINQFAYILVLVEEYQDLFQMTPGLTDLACHFIPNMGNLVMVPPQRVPAQYREEINRQLEEMHQLGIITESNSPWMRLQSMSGRNQNSICASTTGN